MRLPPHALPAPASSCLHSLPPNAFGVGYFPLERGKNWCVHSDARNSGNYAQAPMAVDSFRYLPRSFIPLYEQRRYEGIDEPVWAPLSKPVTEATFALLTSAGVYLPASQRPFDLDRERAEPTWGDPTFRVIPADATEGDIDVAHLHINTDPIRTDLDVALPLRTFRRLADDGEIGAVAAEHYSVMGYQEPGAEVWITETGPEIAARCHAADVDVLVLAPA